MSHVNVYRYSGGQLAYYLERKDIVDNEVLAALWWLKQGLEDQDWKHVKIPDQALVDEVLGECGILFAGNAIVAFTVAEPWFLVDQLTISEEFIAPRWNGSVDLAEVMAGLEAVGRKHNCHLVSVGTRANLKQLGLAGLFEKTGARLSTIELVKEIPYEQEN
ncbi:hypothetical protein Konnatiik_00031 [Pseudomonas phage vB_PpuP-Konnatiik]